MAAVALPVRTCRLLEPSVPHHDQPFPDTDLFIDVLFPLLSKVGFQPVKGLNPVTEFWTRRIKALESSVTTLSQPQPLGGDRGSYYTIRDGVMTALFINPKSRKSKVVLSTGVSKIIVDGGCVENGVALAIGIVDFKKLADKLADERKLTEDQRPEYFQTKRTQFCREAEALKCVAESGHHSFVRTFCAVMPGEDHVGYFVFERCDRDLLAVTVSKKVDVERAREIGREILSAIDFLHTELEMVHRDIKPGNILLDAEGKVKIADFGNASRIDAVEERIVGTVKYFPPEFLHENRVGDWEEGAKRQDVWGGGIIFWRLLGKELPYVDGDSRVDYLTRLGAGAWLDLTGLSEQDVRVIEKVLAIDPEKRATAGEAVSLMSTSL